MRAGRAALSAASLLLAGVCAFRWTQDRSWRLEAARFAAGGLADDRRPARAADALLEPAGDLAAAAAIADAVRNRPRSLPAGLLREARDRLLDAAAARPGWAAHRYLIGITDGDAAGERARRVLLLAARSEPGVDDPWIALAQADLAAWPVLSAADRGSAEEVFRHALLSEEFVSGAYADVEAALGKDRSRAILPDDADVLSAAAGRLAEAGDLPGAAVLLARSRASEFRERERDLAELEKRRALGDTDRLRRGCQAWYEYHPFQEQDDPEGRRQVARLLALWPRDRVRPWARDPRGRLARFFLDGRMSSISAETLLTTVESLTGVPDPVRARALLAAGKPAAATALARPAAPVPEWDPYFLELAARELSAGRAAEAATALSRLSLPAREGCEALIARRGILRALGDLGGASEVDARLDAMSRPPSDDLASLGSLAICIDPEAGRRLEIVAPPGEPALVSWGWDRGRAGTVLVEGSGGAFDLTLSGLSGRRTLWATLLAGGERRSLHIVLKAPP